MRYDLTKPKSGLRPFLSDSFDYGGVFTPISNAGKTALVSFPYYYLKWYESVPFVIDSDSRDVGRPKVGRPDGIHDWVYDATGYPKAGLTRFADDGQIWVENKGKWGFEDLPKDVTPFWYNSKSDILAVDNRGMGTNKIVRFDLERGQVSEVILKDDVSDVAQRSYFHRQINEYGIYSAKDGEIVAINAPASHNGGQAIISAKWRKLANFVKSKAGADFIRIISISENGTRALFRTGGPTDPGSY